MIYSIGHKKSYEFYFAEQGNPHKLGSCNGYPGGSVWRTEAEARKECSVDYDVYGVLADWDKDTAISSEEGASWHNLLKTSALVIIEASSV